VRSVVESMHCPQSHVSFTTVINSTGIMVVQTTMLLVITDKLFSYHIYIVFNGTD